MCIKICIINLFIYINNMDDAFEQVYAIAKFYDISDELVMLKVIDKYKKMRLHNSNITCKDILNVLYSEIYPNLYDKLPPEVLSKVTNYLKLPDIINLIDAYPRRTDIYKDKYIVKYHPSPFLVYDTKTQESKIINQKLSDFEKIDVCTLKDGIFYIILNKNGLLQMFTYSMDNVKDFIIESDGDRDNKINIIVLSRNNTLYELSLASNLIVTVTQIDDNIAKLYNSYTYITTQNTIVYKGYAPYSIHESDETRDYRLDQWSRAMQLDNIPTDLLVTSRCRYILYDTTFVCYKRISELEPSLIINNVKSICVANHNDQCHVLLTNGILLLCAVGAVANNPPFVFLIDTNVHEIYINYIVYKSGHIKEYEYNPQDQKAQYKLTELNVAAHPELLDYLFVSFGSKYIIFPFGNIQHLHDTQKFNIRLKLLSLQQLEKLSYPNFDISRLTTHEIGQGRYAVSVWSRI